MQSSLDSIEEECLQLRTILERTQRAALGGNHVLLETIEDQSKVIQNLERELRALADEASKIEYERTKLITAVSEMNKAYDRCQSELRETSAALKASQEAEERSDIQQTLQKLLQKLQEKERSTAVLRSENEVLASKVRELSDASGDAMLLNKVEIATSQVDKLQREMEEKVREVEKERLRCLELSTNIEILRSHRKNDERRIAEMQEAAVRSESEKLERDEQLVRLKAEREDAYRISQELSKSVEELTNSKAELLVEVEQLQSAVFTLEGELEHLKVSYVTCNDKLADASEQNTNKDAIVAKLRSANRAAKEVVTTSEENLARARAELENSETERKCLEERVATLEGELGATTNDFAAYERSMEEKLIERNNLIEVIQSTAEALRNTYEHKLSSIAKEHDTRIEQVNQAVADFVTEFLAAYSQSQESLMRLGVTLSDADFNAEPHAQSWIDNVRVATEQIPRWKDIVVACYEVIGAHQRQIEEAEEKVENLASRVDRSNDTEAKIEAELREQHKRSLVLANELQFAEAQVAESAREITEMSKALIDAKKELARLFRLVEDQKDLKAKTEALIRERNDAECRSAEMSNTLASLNKKLEEVTNAS